MLLPVVSHPNTANIMEDPTLSPSLFQFRRTVCTRSMKYFSCMPGLCRSWQEFDSKIQVFVEEINKAYAQCNETADSITPEFNADEYIHLMTSKCKTASARLGQHASVLQQLISDQVPLCHEIVNIISDESINTTAIPNLDHVLSDVVKATTLILLSESALCKVLKKTATHIPRSVLFARVSTAHAHIDAFRNLVQQEWRATAEAVAKDEYTSAADTSAKFHTTSNLAEIINTAKEQLAEVQLIDG